MMANDLDKKLRRKDLMKFGYGGFDNLAGPLGRDAVMAGHVLQLAALAGGAEAELVNMLKISFPAAILL